MNFGELTKAIQSGNFGNFDTIIEKLGNNVSKMKEQGGKTTELENFLNQVTTLANNLKQTDNQVTDEPSSVDSDEYKFFLYDKRLSKGLLELSNPEKLARLKHDIELEKKYINLLNGTYQELPSNSPTSIVSCSTSTPNDKQNDSNQIKQYREGDGHTLNQEGQEEFMKILHNDIERQQNIHLFSLQLDILLKMVYLHQETDLLDTMLEQQDALVRGLSDWSDYLDQQTHEYAEMYEKMDSIISTQRRKSSFTVRDIQSLEKWTYGSHVVFWILIASSLLMVIVYNFTSIQKVANSVDKNLNKLRKAT